MRSSWMRDEKTLWSVVVVDGKTLLLAPAIGP